MNETASFSYCLISVFSISTFRSDGIKITLELNYSDEHGVSPSYIQFNFGCVRFRVDQFYYENMYNLCLCICVLSLFLLLFGRNFCRCKNICARTFSFHFIVLLALLCCFSFLLYKRVLFSAFCYTVC